MTCDIENWSKGPPFDYPFQGVEPKIFTENDLHEYVRLQKRPLRRQLRAQKATIKTLMMLVAYRSDNVKISATSVKIS